LEGRRGDDRIGEPEIVLFPQIDRPFFDLSGYVYDRDIVQKPLELLFFLRVMDGYDKTSSSVTKDRENSPSGRASTEIFFPIR
jgi:hypothetical protein